VFVGDTREIHDGYPIKQGLCTVLVLFLGLTIRRIHLLCYTQIAKFQLKSTYVLLRGFVIHTTVSRRTEF